MIGGESSIRQKNILETSDQNWTSESLEACTSKLEEILAPENQSDPHDKVIQLQQIYRTMDSYFNSQNQELKEIYMGLESNWKNFQDEQPAILESFANSLEELRNTPIHESLQKYFHERSVKKAKESLASQNSNSNNESIPSPEIPIKEKLIDVYHDESKMMSWRDQCVRIAQQFTKKLQKVKDRCSFLDSSFSALEQDQLLLSSLDSCLPEDYTPQFNSICAQLNFNPTTFSEQMRDLSQELSDLTIRQAKLRKDFSDFRKPERFLASYPDILKEIHRRTLVNQVLKDQIAPLNEIIVQEQQNRREFLKMNYDQIPEKFIPQLECKPVMLNFMRDQELGLPLIRDQNLPIQDLEFVTDFLCEKSDFNLGTINQESNGVVTDEQFLKQKLKKFKVQLKQCQNMNDQYLSQIQDLSKSDESNQDQTSKIKSVLERVCQTNHTYIKQLKSGSKSQLKQKVQELQTHLQEMQKAQTELISKSEHKDFVAKLHQIHSNELKTLSTTFKDQLEGKLTQISKLEETNNKLTGQIEDIKINLDQKTQCVELEQKAKIQVLNELQFKKLEIQKLQQQYEQKLKTIESQLSKKDDLVYEATQKLTQIQLKHKEQVSQLEESIQDYQAKLKEKRQEFDSLSKKYTAQTEDNLKETNRLETTLSSKEEQLFVLKQKADKLSQDNTQQSCQVENFKQVISKYKEENAQLIRNLKTMQSEFKEVATLIDQKDLQINQLTKTQQQMIVQKQPSVVNDFQVQVDLNQSQAQDYTNLSFLELAKGCRAIFLPGAEPGQYFALDLTQEDLSEFDSQSQMSSQASTTSGVIKKFLKQADLSLCLDSQPVKIKHILSNFEMIVIGEVLEVQSNSDYGINQAHVRVEKLIAFYQIKNF